MASKKTMTFEDATGRLNELVKAMESGSLPLDDMINAFEEGKKLVTFCTKKLQEVERRVTVIKENDKGVVSEDPFPDAGLE